MDLKLSDQRRIIKLKGETYGIEKKEDNKS